MARSLDLATPRVLNQKLGRTRAPATLLPMLSGLLFFSSCVSNTYEIEMSLDDLRGERSLVGSSVSESNSGEKYLSPDEEKQIAAAYGTTVRHEGGKSVVTTKFVAKLPVDVGGAGYVHHYHSLMGTLSVYLERFRGSDDVVERIDEMTEAVERLVELAQLWVRAEGRDAESVGKVEAYLAEDARRDLRNLGLFIWTLHAAQEFNQFNSEEAAGDVWAEAVARLVQYAVERGYVDLDDVPKINRMRYAELETVLRLFRELLAKKLLTDVEGIKEAFPPLETQSAFETSVSRLVSGEEIEKLLADFTFFGISSYDLLTVRFRLPERPFAVNGSWEDESAVWTASLALPDEPPRHVLPTQFFAAWSMPEDRYQRQHFGRVVLDGRNLGDYVLWYLGLSEQESQQWDTFMKGVSPDDDFLERLDVFQFSFQSDASAEQESRVLDELRRLFKAAMNPYSD